MYIYPLNSTTQDVKAPRLLHHDCCVDLTHVTALVLQLDLNNLEGPSSMLVVSDPDPGVVRDDTLVES